MKSRTKLALIVCGVLALAAAVLLARSAGQSSEIPLAHNNPGPAGAQAVLRVAADQGLEISETMRAAEVTHLLQRSGDGEPTLVIAGSSHIDTDLLQEWVEASSRIIWIEPRVRDLPHDWLPSGLEVSIASTNLQFTGSCSDLFGSDKQLILEHTEQTRVWQATQTASECFHSSEGSLLVQAQTVSNLWLLSDAFAFRNDTVLSADHAAFALNTLLSSDSLVWLTPTGTSVVDASGPLPSWMLSLPIVGGYLLVVVAFWLYYRGRRFGPVIGEDLPVETPPSEHIVGRAKLYQASREYDYVYDTLRSEVLSDIAVRLGLSTSASLDELTQRITETTSLPNNELERLLRGSPRSDKELVAMSRQLQTLKGEVYHS